MSSDRYRDHPLLRLLDCCILDVIGELPAQQKEVLEKLEPRLHEVFASKGNGLTEEGPGEDQDNPAGGTT